MDLIMVLGGPYLDTELPQPFSFEPALFYTTLLRCIRRFSHYFTSIRREEVTRIKVTVGGCSLIEVPIK